MISDTSPFSIPGFRLDWKRTGSLSDLFTSDIFYDLDTWLPGDDKTLMTTAPAETGGVAVPFPFPFTSPSSSSLIVEVSPIGLSPDE